MVYTLHKRATQNYQLKQKEIKMEHVCVVCGHVHNEETEGKWEDLPEDFLCPECGCGKEEYEEL